MANTHYLMLIDYVPLQVALATPPGGGLWDVVMINRREGTGYATAQVAVTHGSDVGMLDYHGPLVTSLGNGQLTEEGIRMRKVIEAATAALAAIEEHLAFRRSVSV